jgi:uncharacterized membrane protein YfcA
VPTPDTFLVSLVFFVVAAVYSTVGHAGASGYLAMMALVGLPFEVMRPTALTLNIFVASLNTWRFYRAKLLEFSSVVPFVAASVPFAFLGGWITPPTDLYRPLVGVLLLISASYLMWQSFGGTDRFIQKEVVIPKPAALLAGAVIGFLSGLSGIGGGVLLSPIILFFGWAGARQTSAIASAFILLNSVAALLGNWTSTRALPDELPFYLGGAMLGSLVGTELGIRWLPTKAIIGLLAVALTLAGGKFLLV